MSKVAFCIQHHIRLQGSGTGVTHFGHFSFCVARVICKFHIVFVTSPFCFLLSMCSCWTQASVQENFMKVTSFFRVKPLCTNIQKVSFLKKIVMKNVLVCYAEVEKLFSCVCSLKEMCEAWLHAWLVLQTILLKPLNILWMGISMEVCYASICLCP